MPNRNHTGRMRRAKMKKDFLFFRLYLVLLFLFLFHFSFVPSILCVFLCSLSVCMMFLYALILCSEVYTLGWLCLGLSVFFLLANHLKSGTELKYNCQQNC